MTLAVFWIGHAYSAESSVDIVGKALPSISEPPLRIIRDVTPGQMVHLKFKALSGNEQNSKIVFSFLFKDIDGDDCQRKYADPSYVSKFDFTWLQKPMVGAPFEIKRIAPPYAASVAIALRNSAHDITAVMNSFELEVRSPTVLELMASKNVWWRYMPWLATLVFAMFFIAGVRRVVNQENTCAGRVCGAMVAGGVASIVAFATWVCGDVIASDHANVIIDFSVFVLLGFVCYSVFEELGERSVIGRHPVVTLAIISLVVHLVVIVLCNRAFNQQMSSDAFLAQQSLEANAIHIGHVGRINSNFAYWCNYELVLSILGMIFGPHLYIGQITNALCCVGLLFPIYDLSRTMVSRKSALFVILAMVLYPTHYFHSTLLTQEYWCALGVCWSIWLMWKTMRIGAFSRRGVVLALMCGSLLGVSQLFKPVSTILVVAMVVGLVVSFIVKGQSRVISNLVMVLLVVTAFAFVSGYGQGVLREIARPFKIAPGKFDIVTRVLAVGLDVKGRGKNTRALVKKYWNQSPEENARDVRKSLRADYVYYPVLMAEKFDRVYGSEEGMRRWFGSSLRKQLTPRVSHLIENYHYLFQIVFLLGTIGFAMSVYQRRIASLAYSVELLVPLFLCGYCAMLLISEAQGRYRVPTHPEMFLMMGYVHVLFRKVVLVSRWNWGRVRMFRLSVAGKRGVENER